MSKDGLWRASTNIPQLPTSPKHGMRSIARERARRTCAFGFFQALVSFANILFVAIPAEHVYPSRSLTAARTSRTIDAPSERQMSDQVRGGSGGSGVGEPSSPAAVVVAAAADASVGAADLTGDDEGGAADPSGLSRRTFSFF